ncbi:unnamed protein product [Oppiella nova]|uniref:Sphingomyelin phosphodiesterase 4 n=1 Tax=Oppiella nova TaxID=334625 RepID=A0A7R9LD85_9ACAR|nr:unnamed protein product [Oppiella nova]CAG2162445.1 unnamed protein product [Oppiella nova]
MSQYLLSDVLSVEELSEQSVHVKTKLETHLMANLKTIHDMKTELKSLRSKLQTYEEIGNELKTRSPEMKESNDQYLAPLEEVLKQMNRICIKELHLNEVLDTRHEDINESESVSQIYCNDSLDRFGDDLCEVLVSYLSLEERIRFECLSKRYQRLLFTAQTMNYSNNYAFNNSNVNSIPFQMRFEGCLKEPIAQKCHSLSQLIHESIANNAKEMQINYQSLVEDVFGVGGHSVSTDWSLKLVTRHCIPREFDAIYSFLHPNGPLFQLIRQLMNDPLNRYEFPKKYLPIPTKLSLDEGVVPSLYANRISHALSAAISVNAFEFFVYHFAYHMVNTSPTLHGQHNPYYWDQLSNANTNPSNVVYFALLESYLNCLVPLAANQDPSPQSPHSQSSIWQSLSSTTSSLLHLGTAANTSLASKPIPQTPTQTSALFKSSILNLKPLLSGGHEQHTTDGRQSLSGRTAEDSLGSEIVKCETFLMILTEIWLNHAIPPALAKRHNASPSKQQWFAPNADHMRAVRILVKHLHYFANSAIKRTNESLNCMDSPLNDLKRSVWSHKHFYQKRLYAFLRLSFERWPNDTSFRLPLETWLSYVQPWRYTSSSPNGARHSDGDDSNAKQEITLTDGQWKQFIADNLLFYSVIFRQLIPRFSRVLDLSSSKNALMLFRLTKVFSQPNLALWIREAENSLTSSDTSGAGFLQNSWSATMTTTSRASLLSPTLRQHNVGSLASNMRHPLMETEANTFEYIPLFCPAIKPLILQLLNEISKALFSISEMIAKAQASEEMAISGLSFLQYVISFFQISEDVTKSDENKRFLVDKMKTKNHLQNACTQLSALFEMPAHESDLITNQSMDGQPVGDNEGTPIVRHRTQALYEERDGTPKLTPFGRTQLLNRQCRPHLNLVEGNPDRQPVRSYEFYYLVQFWLFVCDWINNRYGHRIQSLYDRPGFVGIFLKQLIAGPTAYIRIVKSGTAYRPPDRVTEVLAPRVNLRFMANKLYLTYALIVWTVVYLLNYSLLSFSSLVFAMYLTYLGTKTLLYYFSSH